MLDVNKLRHNKPLIDKVRYYVIGMADAKAEILQQEVDMMANPDLDDDRYGTVLEARVDKLTDALLQLSDMEADPIEVIRYLDKWFKFLSEPECLANVATRAAAVEMCRHMIEEHNETLSRNDELDHEDIAYLTDTIKFLNQIRFHVLNYKNLMDK